MQAGQLVVLTFVLGNTSLIAEPVLTAPESGAFEYTFGGNTVAQFGATELLIPSAYAYPPSSPFPISPALFAKYVSLSDTGVWDFSSKFTLCCLDEWILTPTTANIAGPGVTVYDSVIHNFYDVAQLMSSTTVPGSATL